MEEQPEHSTEEQEKAMLPRLPVPPLQQTLRRYLEAIQAVVSQEAYQKTKAIVEEFGKPGGLGEEIQNELHKKRGREENWSYRYWSEDMYMNVKLPLPNNSNPGMVWPRVTFETLEDRIKYVAKFVRGMTEYNEILNRRGLPLDKGTGRDKAYLCMNQYYQIFKTYRVPGIEKDHHEFHGIDGGCKDQHIILASRNQFYEIPVKMDNALLTEEEIASLVKAAENNSMVMEPREPKSGVGVLTSMRREKWALAREYLLQDAHNASLLKRVESCMFLVCLDQPLPTDYPLARGKVNATAMNFLNGAGTHLNSCNRWFDKTIQFIFQSDGHCGLNYEHSVAEGIAVIQAVENLLQAMPEKINDGTPLNDSTDVKHLDFNLDATALAWIDAAKLEFDSEIENVELNMMYYSRYGRDFPKRHKCSPDSYIQLAMQLAHYRLHGKLVFTYESASTRRFLLGRVDNIRASTPEALAFAKGMLDETIGLPQKRELFKVAMKKQTDIMIQNITGQGIDIHLLGLREMAKEMGKTPEIFQDETYWDSNHFELSTSQVPTVTDSYMFYGPVVPTGYGASYNPHSQYIVFCVSAFRKCEWTSAFDFGKAIETALDDMHDLIVATTPTEE
ncbi:unnamed protein product [Cyprideis torosa]|uniref:Choline O-acetyltransferase n=1 Tax=Cyprideis torosa TaxID=163714 RepID=A0A7R8ZIW4_9CRUS|nr:unnamed protein product [Cyprideis torosa]CAG0880885.1 unnamed protein product [Cyprideis torosa]